MKTGDKVKLVTNLKVTDTKRKTCSTIEAGATAQILDAYGNKVNVKWDFDGWIDNGFDASLFRLL